jgi:Flp pilus assembly pilin Flp
MFKTIRKQVARRLGRLHRDESGAEMLEYILLVAVVALPLVGLLIWFRSDITTWVKGVWDDVKGQSQTPLP